MVNLYGINCTNAVNENRDLVFFANSLDEALVLFEKNFDVQFNGWKLKEGPFLINSNKAFVLYQFAREVVDNNILPFSIGPENDMITIDDIRFGTVSFDKFHLHFNKINENEGQLLVMLSLANGKPNWLY